MAQQTLVGQYLLITKPSRSHLDTPHSIGLLWTSDKPDAVNSTLQRRTLTRDRHPFPGGFRTRNLSKRAAADPRFRMCGHRHQLSCLHWRQLYLQHTRISLYDVYSTQGDENNSELFRLTLKYLSVLGCEPDEKAYIKKNSFRKSRQ